MPYLIDIIIVYPPWKAKKVKPLIRQVATKTLSSLNIPQKAGLCIKLSSNAEIKELNKIYRHKDAPTNVLSFPIQEFPHQTSLGDIILAFETVEEEAISQHKKFEHHLAHLVVHGVLHLLGYDHEQESNALLMESLESQILKPFNIKDPYNCNE